VLEIQAGHSKPGLFFGADHVGGVNRTNHGDSQGTLLPDLLLISMGVPIPVIDEQWAHSMEAHGDLADNRYDFLETVRLPDVVVAGRAREFVVMREIGLVRWLVVI
jgi:hypothetical protein